jgi:predicted ribosome quality control (RQC) complex YloA/Tae2 family protein
VLTRVSMPVPFDRIVQLDFAPRLTDAPALHVMCEVQGRYSNAIVTDGSKEVLLAARQVGAGQSSARNVRVGAQYPLPPPPPGCAPRRDTTLDEWQRALDAWVGGQKGEAHSAARVLAGALQGVSPALARELCAAAGVPVDAPWADVATSNRQALHEAVQGWLARVESGSFAATRDPATSAVSVLGSFCEKCDSVHDAVDARYRGAQAEERFSGLHARLTSATANAQRTTEKKIVAFQKQLDGARDAEATQKLGDMFMANVHQWPQGATEFEAEDWDTGATSALQRHDTASRRQSSQ